MPDLVAIQRQAVRNYLCGLSLTECQLILEAQELDDREGTIRANPERTKAIREWIEELKEELASGS